MTARPSVERAKFTLAYKAVKIMLELGVTSRISRRDLFDRAAEGETSVVVNHANKKQWQTSFLSRMCAYFFLYRVDHGSETTYVVATPVQEEWLRYLLDEEENASLKHVLYDTGRIPVWLNERMGSAPYIQEILKARHPSGRMDKADITLAINDGMDAYIASRVGAASSEETSESEGPEDKLVDEPEVESEGEGKGNEPANPAAQLALSNFKLLKALTELIQEQGAVRQAQYEELTKRTDWIHAALVDMNSAKVASDSAQQHAHSVLASWAGEHQAALADLTVQLRELRKMEGLAAKVELLTMKAEWWGNTVSAMGKNIKEAERVSKELGEDARAIMDVLTEPQSDGPRSDAVDSAVSGDVPDTKRA